MSAGSKTNPGGYTDEDSLEQFEVSDDRSVDEISTFLDSAGYDVVWKDWDKSYDEPSGMPDLTSDDSIDKNRKNIVFVN
jgi:2-iminoacetate synthase